MTLKVRIRAKRAQDGEDGAEMDREVTALLDSGSQGDFIDSLLAKELGLEAEEGQTDTFRTLNGQTLPVRGHCRALL